MLIVHPHKLLWQPSIQQKGKYINYLAKTAKFCQKIKFLFFWLKMTEKKNISTGYGVEHLSYRQNV